MCCCGVLAVAVGLWILFAVIDDDCVLGDLPWLGVWLLFTSLVGISDL